MKNKECLCCIIIMMVIVGAGVGIALMYYKTILTNPNNTISTTQSTTQTTTQVTEDPHVDSDKYRLIFGHDVPDATADILPVTLKVWATDFSYYYEWHDISPNTELMGDYVYEVIDGNDWQVTIECWSDDVNIYGGGNITLNVGLNAGTNYGFAFYPNGDSVEVQRGYFRWIEVT